MKGITKVFIVAFVSLRANLCSGQTTATSFPSAIIITPTSIAKNSDMHFGAVDRLSVLTGKIVLAPADKTTINGVAAQPITKSNVSPARFTVSGQANYTYVITLPTSCTITDEGNPAMVINKFTSTPATIGSINANGLQTLIIGATLNMGAMPLVTGTYTNTTNVPVTVNYN